MQQQPQYTEEDLNYIKENSHVEIVCRIRKNKRDFFTSKLPLTNSVKSNKTRRCRSRSKTKSKVNTTSATRTPRNNSNKSSKRATTPKHREIGQKCSVFASKEHKNTVIASENPISTKIVETSVIDADDLDYFSSTIFGGAQLFEFDKVAT